MFQVLQQAELYDPVYRGRQDIWVVSGTIVAIGQNLPNPPANIEHERVDLGGARVIPGLIDGHVHLTGGGGEDGPGTRVPRLEISKLIAAGITSCIGVLGTDTTTRTMRDLVATTMGVREQGLSAWCYTGGYQVPPATLTGSVRDDIVFVDPIIGVGELAISDHRSSQPTLDEFLRVASDSYVAGMVSKKSGVLHIHMGDGVRGFELVSQAIESAEIPSRVYHPTHINRQKRLFHEAPALVERGVTVDITAFPGDDETYSASEAMDRWIRGGHSLDRITCSSDGAGCLPEFDADGRLIRMGIGDPGALSATLKELLDAGHDLGVVLPAFTRNVARVAGLKHKGCLELGAHGDLVVLSEQGEVQSVMAGGAWVLRDGELLKTGNFEG
mgnify:CR=1 FL=1